MQYKDLVIISIRPARGNGYDPKQYHARFAEEDGPYADLEAFGASPSIALARLEAAQIDDLLEHFNLQGADTGE